jgi:hypothetical protein
MYMQIVYNIFLLLTTKTLTNIQLARCCSSRGRGKTTSPISGAAGRVTHRMDKDERSKVAAARLPLV